MFLWTSITNPYAIYTRPAGVCATMLGQSKNCSSLYGIKASLKLINDLQTQSFPNSSKGLGDWKFYWGGGIFFTGWREPEEEWFWEFKPFSKLKTAFCEYWTSIKIEINMTCVSKSMKLKQEYEIKTKMEQEQWLLLKMLFLLG